MKISLDSRYGSTKYARAIVRCPGWTLLAVTIGLFGGASSRSGAAACPVATEPKSPGVEVRAALAPTAPPRPDHVLIVMEENHHYTQVINSGQAPYIDALWPQGVLFTNYFAIEHPSEPNYLDLFSGSNQGITDDSCRHTHSTPNLGAALLAAGFSFGAYSEDLPVIGDTTCFVGNYDSNHAPWTNWQGASANAIPAAVHLPFSDFPTDYSTLPRVSFVVPNVLDDMHNGTVAQGDAWLKTNIDAYAQWAKTNNSLLIVLWDEDDSGGDNQVAMIMVGAVVQKKIQNNQLLNHYSFCRLICDMYGLVPMANAATATPIQGVWQAGGGSPPSVTMPASATPSSVTGTTTALTVLGSDAGGEAALLYNWSSSGPAPVTFSPNGTNGAKNTSATFGAAGNYTVTCTLSNASGGTITSSCVVTVTQTQVSAGVTPPSVSVVMGGSVQFTVTALDQFGLAISVQPAFTWTVSGGGTINGTGNFSAGTSSGGPFLVTASGGGLTATGSVTVTTSPPVLMTIQVTPATASVAPNGTRQFTAVGLDQIGNSMTPQPTFGWTVSGGGSVDSSGLFSAGAAAGGPFTLQATSGSVSATAAVTVAVPLPPSGPSGSAGGGCGSMGLDMLAPLGILMFIRRRRGRSSFAGRV